MQIVSVVGARPQFVKLAPVNEGLSLLGVQHSIIHSGQHYDVDMSDALFQDFNLPEPTLNLGVGSGSHAQTTARILQRVDEALMRLGPDLVVVYGDTDTTVAAALAAVKRGFPLAHVEAGLRSFNRTMPEETNRILTDHAADLLFAPTETAMSNLVREGLEGRAVVTGDVMADICLRTAKRVREHPPDIDLPVEDFILATLHRPYNTDDPKRLSHIVTALSQMPIPVLLPAHPRLRARAKSAGISLKQGNIWLADPLDYSTLIFTAQASKAIVTDSGGLQKEAFLLGVPCTTIRTETEWPETLMGGWNELCFNFTSRNLIHCILRSKPVLSPESPFGDGTASQTITQILRNYVENGIR